MRSPTLGQLARNYLADEGKIKAENLWDAAANFIIEKGWISTPASRKLLFAAMSALGATAQVNLDDQTLMGKLIAEIGGDAASEIHRRLTLAAQSPTPRQTATPNVAIRNILEELTSSLNRYADQGAERS